MQGAGLGAFPLIAVEQVAAYSTNTVILIYEKWRLSACLFAHFSAHQQHEGKAGPSSSVERRPLALSCLRGRQLPMQSIKKPSARQERKEHLRK